MEEITVSLDRHMLLITVVLAYSDLAGNYILSFLLIPNHYM